MKICTLTLPGVVTKISTGGFRFEDTSLTPNKIMELNDYIKRINVDNRRKKKKDKIIINLTLNTGAIIHLAVASQRFGITCEGLVEELQSVEESQV